MIVDTSIRVVRIPIEASRVTMAIIVMEKSDSSDLLRIVRAKNNRRHLIAPVDIGVLDVSRSAGDEIFVGAVGGVWMPAHVVPDILAAVP